jgi:subtilisin
MALRIASAAFVFVLVSTFAHAQQQQRLIIGVTDVAHAQRQLPQAQVRHRFRIIRALAVVGDPERLRRLPFVRYVEPDPIDAVHIMQATETVEYGVNNIDAEVVWGGSQGATTVVPGQGGAGARVAVVDTGVDCGHEDLAGGCVYGANFTGAGQPFDGHGHGTHVAGIIGARQNGVGTVGVAPESTIYAVKVLADNGSGALSWVAAGIDWAVANNMDVINMSLGASSGSIALAEAVAAAQAAGVLVVSAAGNSGCCNTVAFPAKYAGSMAVGAVDVNDVIASFSSTGPEVDISAPGVAVRSSVPVGTCASGLCDPTGYKTLNGTSMATPHVAGVGALLMSRGFTAAQAWYAMTSTARDLGATGYDTFYGHGRVNALAAVNSTPTDPPPPPPPPPVDNIAPTVQITSPFFFQRVFPNTTFTIRASASDNVGVSRVEFYVDLVGKCVDTTAPFTCNWTVPPGRNLYYLIEAIAYDAAGNYGYTYTIAYTR